MIRKDFLKLFALIILFSVFVNECSSFSIADWLTSVKKVVDKKNSNKNNEQHTTSTKLPPNTNVNHMTHATNYKTTTKYSIKITPFDPIKFLQTNGYTLGDLTKEKILSSSIRTDDFKNNNEMKDMVSLFQRLHHINVTGNLDSETMKQMTAPRCGFPDILPPTEQPDQKMIVSSFKTYSAKWDRKNLTYKINSFSDLGQEKTRDIMAKAFNYWSNYAELNFKECFDCKSDFVIGFSQDDHGDGFPFDGKGHVLAHAFFPKNGQIHFDSAEPFTEDTHDGINLRIVAAHEIGHALGLEHSFVKGALMYPYYAGYTKDFDLNEDDVLGIQSIYGRRKSGVASVTPASPTQPKQTPLTTKSATFTHKPEMPSNSTPCVTKTSFDAIFYTPKGHIFVLLEHTDFWLFNITSKIWNKVDDMSKLYEKMENSVRGGVKCSKNITWFFKGKKVWAYRGVSLLPNFPQEIKDPLFPRNPYTAVFINGSMWVLKGFLAYKFDTSTLRIIGSQPSYVSMVFPGIPDRVDASIEHLGIIYFFKGFWVYKFDTNLNKTIGSVKTKNEAWPPCSAPGSFYSKHDLRKL